MTAFLAKKPNKPLTDAQFSDLLKGVEQYNDVQGKLTLIGKQKKLLECYEKLENKVTAAAKLLMLKEGPMSALSSINEAILNLAEAKKQINQLECPVPNSPHDALQEKYEQALKTMQLAQQKFEEAEGFEKAEKAKKEFFSKITTPASLPESVKQKKPATHLPENKKASISPNTQPNIPAPKASSSVAKPKTSQEGTVKGLISPLSVKEQGEEDSEKVNDFKENLPTNRSLLEIQRNIDLSQVREFLKSKKVNGKDAFEVFEQYLLNNPSASLKDGLNYIKLLRKEISSTTT